MQSSIHFSFYVLDEKSSLQIRNVDGETRPSVKNCNWSYLQGLACTEMDDVAKTQMQCIKCDDVCYESCTSKVSLYFQSR